MVTATKTSAPGQVRDAASAKLRPKIETLEARIEAQDDRVIVVRRRLGELPREEERARARSVAAGESSWESVKAIADERRDLEAELESLGRDLMGLQSDLRVLWDEADKLEREAVLAAGEAVVERQRARVADAAEEFARQCAELFGALTADERELDEWRLELRGMGREQWALNLMSGLNLYSPGTIARILAEGVR
jgi:chromosome segregation ATPase